jgi:DnaK suppressor protein
MNKRAMKKYENRLIKRRDELVKIFNKTKTYSLESQESASQDIADKASSAYNKEFLLNLTDTERRELQRIEEALERIQNGKYGVCVACGCNINLKRLDAVPWAAQCITCQEEHENAK